MEQHAPHLFLGLLALVLLGSGVLLVWSPSSEHDFDLTPEELRVLEEAARSQSTVSEEPLSTGRASGGVESGSAVLQVETSPAGARVSIDGETEGVTPLRLEHLPSRYYFVSVDRPGFSARDTLVYLDADAPTTIALSLTPLARAEEAPDPVASPTPAPASSPAPPVSRPESPPAAERPPPPARTSGTITARVDPAGAAIRLDGRTVGVAPAELDNVPPGSYTLTFSRPGYETAAVRIEVEPGARETIDVTLVPLSGTLAVVVRPWGSIYIDGVLHARETDVSFETTLPVGSHQIRVEHPHLGIQERVVEVRADRTTSAVFDLN